MRTKVRDIRKEDLEQVLAKDQCHHYWLIESAKGPTSRGTCKICGTTKDFFNAIPEAEPNAVKRHVAFREMPELTLDSTGSQSSES